MHRHAIWYYLPVVVESPWGVGVGDNETKQVLKSLDVHCPSVTGSGVVVVGSITSVRVNRKYPHSKAPYRFNCRKKKRTLLAKSIPPTHTQVLTI